MRTSRLVQSVVVIGALAAAGLPVAAAGHTGEVELRAPMVGAAAYPGARGHAEYEAGDGHREFDLHLAGLHALAGRRLVVRVHGDVVGSMVVGSLGRAHLDRHTAVRMAAGNVVRVRLRPTGRLVSHGTLVRVAHD